MKTSTTALCPICNATHTVTPAELVDDRTGAPLSAEEAVMTAHYRDEIIARSAAPFVVTFATPKPARRAAPSRVRRQCGAILSPRGCSPWHADRNNTCAKVAR